MLMMAKEARLEIHICHHKNVHKCIPNKVTLENNTDKAPLHMGSESRKAVGHQPLTGTAGPIQVGLSSVSSKAVTVASTPTPISQEKPSQAGLTTRTGSFCSLLWSPAETDTLLWG